MLSVVIIYAHSFPAMHSFIYNVIQLVNHRCT